jgi:hypothetical protein
LNRGGLASSGRCWKVGPGIGTRANPRNLMGFLDAFKANAMF